MQMVSLFFLWFFFPLAFMIYCMLKPLNGTGLKNFFLLLVSLFFYAWGEPHYILLLILFIVFNYVVGLLVGTKEGAFAKICCIVGCSVNVGLLFVFKYLGWVLNILNCVAGNESIFAISMPIGLSFYTFHGISYIIDVYRKDVKSEKNIISLALYISFFPKLIAGPIIKFKEISEQLKCRSESLEKTGAGVKRFILGLGKKVLIANVLGNVVQNISDIGATHYSLVSAWMITIFYTLQLYYDFSGYSDMAIGMASMFGFDFKENFVDPYIATSIKDFWRRWHISLGTWFREYVYIPLGGNRKGKIRTCINYLIVFALTGIWHGASMNFLLWGTWHGLFIILEYLGVGQILKKHRWFAHIYTLIVVNIGWILFRCSDFREALLTVMKMFDVRDLGKNMTIPVISHFHLAVTTFFIAIIGCFVCKRIKLFFMRETKIIKIVEWVMYLFIGLLSIIFIMVGTYNPFIYYRF